MLDGRDAGGLADWRTGEVWEVKRIRAANGWRSECPLPSLLDENSELMKGVGAFACSTISGRRIKSADSASLDRRCMKLLGYWALNRLLGFSA